MLYFVVDRDVFLQEEEANEHRLMLVDWYQKQEEDWDDQIIPMTLEQIAADAALLEKLGGLEDLPPLASLLLLQYKRTAKAEMEKSGLEINLHILKEAVPKMLSALLTDSEEVCLGQMQVVRSVFGLSTLQLQMRR